MTWAVVVWPTLRSPFDGENVSDRLALACQLKDTLPTFLMDRVALDPCASLNLQLRISWRGRRFRRGRMRNRR